VSTAEQTHPVVGILGLGLIGGSLLRRLHSQGRQAVGWNRDPAGRAAARSQGLQVRDEPADVVVEADVLVTAVPLPVLADLLPLVSAAARPGTILTDVTSVKTPVRALAASLAPQLRFVGGHPMAGTEHSGFAASEPGLFEGAVWVVCRESDTDPQAWDAVADLAHASGARVIEATALSHDEAVARISHVPHLLAAALAASAAEGGELPLQLGAGSFRDSTRVAATRPELSAAMCAGNRQAVLEALDDLTARLAQVRSAVASTRGDVPSAELLEFFGAGRVARLAWEDLHAQP
jgi:prephenate dehydrogenase